MNGQTISAKTTIGAASVLAAVLCFSLNDVTIKFLSGDYALHQIVLIRSIVGLVVLMAVIVPLEGGLSILKTNRLAMHLVRGLCVVIANMTFFLGLAVLPLADTVAVFFVSPLIITILSVWVLKEKVGPHRWIAVGIGLTGVMIMMRPGTESFRIALVFPILAAAAYSMLHILTRKLGIAERAATMAFYIQITFIFTSGLIGLLLGSGHYSGQGGVLFEFLLRGWVWPDPSDYGLFILIGAASAVGGYFISQAYRLSEASLIAPLEYAAVPVAIFFGVVIFGEWPDLTGWVGTILIIGAGLFVFLRETIADDRPPLATPPRRR